MGRARDMSMPCPRCRFSISSRNTLTAVGLLSCTSDIALDVEMLRC